MKNLLLTLVCSFLLGNILSAQNDLSFAKVTFNNEHNFDKQMESSPDFAYAPLKKPAIQEIIQDIQSRAIYPRQAEEYGVEGTVRLELLYDGNVQNINVIESSSNWLEDAAIDAVQNFVVSHSQDAEVSPSVEPVTISVLFRFTL